MEEIICNCMQISKSEIEDSIKKNKLQTIDEVREETYANTACGRCYDKVKKILNTTKVDTYFNVTSFATT